jgi:FecR protein
MDLTERHFALLAQRVLDGIATDAECAEVAQLAREREDLVVGFLDELMIDALLNWQSGDITEPNVIADFSHDVDRQRTNLFAPVTTRPLLWAVSAILLVALSIATWQLSRPTLAPSMNPVDHATIMDAIADIVEQNGVAWSDDSTALLGERLIVPGRLTSGSGEYTLQFRSGAKLRVVGAASIEIKSKMLVQLDRGQATASVPKSSIGFTITSPLVNVVDQGTQFGISAGGGRADVIVFDGKVDLHSNVGGNAGQTRLTQGEGVQINGSGLIDRLVDVRRDIQGRWWTADDPNPDRNLIARVTDNISPGDSKKYVCYQTTYQGLQDDALAYSDNSYHQWNGLTPAGLPAFLRGADYIRTFNDYRYLLNFQMTVELSKPANLYVIADNRIPPPDWLKSQFEDTGVDIGLDEGPWGSGVEEKYRQFDTHTTAVGGGRSIDNTFSVWRRRCVDATSVTLGNAGEWGTEGKRGRAMYGIAATPLDVDENTPVHSAHSKGGS